MPGPLELLVIGALALIVFGPNRLPQIARSIGKAVNEFRRQAADLKSEFDFALDEEDDDTPGHIARAKAKDEIPEPSQDPDPTIEEEAETAGTMDPDPTASPPADPDSDKS
jgi:TatA/E family protein of Tat protein translocase